MSNRPSFDVDYTTRAVDSAGREYLNMNTFFNMPDADMKLMLEEAAESPPCDSEII